MHRRALATVTLAVFFLITASLATAQTVSFTRSSYAFGESGVADFNNDGCEDIIGPAGVDSPSFTVALCNGDGTYAPARTYTMPGGYFGSFAVADFNGDGWADLIISAGSNGFYYFENDGNGVLGFKQVFAPPYGTGAGNVVAGDFNHDGKMDIAWINTTSSTPYLTVWFGNGAGGFTYGPSTPASYTGFLFVGDFDGDGKADLLLEDHDYGTALEVMYGDGTGNFPNRVFPTEPGQGGTAQMVVADVNGDGRSDIIGSPLDFSINGSTYVKRMDVLYGNADRSFTGASIPTNNCVTPQPPTVADFNGDGQPDIAVLEYADCNGSEPESVNVMLRNADGTYQPEQALYNNSSGTNLQDLRVLRADQGAKPDFGVTEFASGANTSTFVLFQDTTNGTFPSCNAADTFTGISVCAPSTSVSSNTVPFQIGASGPSLMRKVEVWVDGVKLKEQLTKAFSHTAYLDANLTLSTGSHNVTIYAAGWDNWLESKSFTLTVGSNSTSCPPPSTASAANVCSPLNGSTVASPVNFIVQGGASVTYMEGWLDGVKIVYVSGAAGTVSYNVSKPVAAGSHKFDVYARVGSTTTFHQTITFTVSGSTSGCPPPSTSSAANYCSPLNGSTVSSPVTFWAVGGSAVTYMEGWLDGVKFVYVSGPAGTVSYKVSKPVASGSHRWAIYARVGSTTTYHQDVYFTVP